MSTKVSVRGMLTLASKLTADELDQVLFGLEKIKKERIKEYTITLQVKIRESRSDDISDHDSFADDLIDFVYNTWSLNDDMESVTVVKD